MQNTVEELDSLKGLTIKGWSKVDIDYGHSFILLETNQKFDNGKVVNLLISADAELNSGGYVGFISKEQAKGLDY
mgnify:FL=1|jgi:hypothetical protein